MKAKEPIRINKGETAEAYLQRLINAGQATEEYFDNSEWVKGVRKGEEILRKKLHAPKPTKSTET